MRKYFWLLYFYILLAAVITACGGGDDNADNSESGGNLSENSNTTEVQAVNSASTTVGETEVSYDPGPYFTPRRNAPENPGGFIPDEAVGDFRRVSVQGTCTNRDGLTSQYVDEANNLVYLRCRYLSARNGALSALQEMATDGTLSGQPIVMKLQGAESFLLGTTGQSYVFAWTHNQWFFTAMSLSGRESLDTFMEALPF